MYPAASRFDPAAAGGGMDSGSVLMTSRTGASLPGISTNQSIAGGESVAGGPGSPSRSPARRGPGSVMSGAQAPGGSRRPTPKVWGHPTRQDSAKDLTARLSVAPGARELLGVDQ